MEYLWLIVSTDKTLTVKRIHRNACKIVGFTLEPRSSYDSNVYAVNFRPNFLLTVRESERNGRSSPFLVIPPRPIVLLAGKQKEGQNNKRETDISREGSKKNENNLPRCCFAENWCGNGVPVRGQIGWWGAGNGDSDRIVVGALCLCVCVLCEFFFFRASVLVQPWKFQS